MQWRVVSACLAGVLLGVLLAAVPKPPLLPVPSHLPPAVHRLSLSQAHTATGFTLRSLGGSDGDLPEPNVLLAIAVGFPQMAAVDALVQQVCAVTA